MHSYRKNGGKYEVYFDCGAQEYSPIVLRTFKEERHAAAFVHYLNGGDGSFLSVPNTSVEGEVDTQ